MSWDIFVQDLPRDAATTADIPDDFTPAPLGPRSRIIQQILEVVPTADFSNPAWGIISGKDWSVEANLGDDEECDGFAFHVRGSDEAPGVVAAILSHVGLRAHLIHKPVTSSWLAPPRLRASRSGVNTGIERSGRADNQPLLWTGPRRVCTLFYS